MRSIGFCFDTSNDVVEECRIRSVEPIDFARLRAICTSRHPRESPRQAAKKDLGD